jgi:hypothetical protein
MDQLTSAAATQLTTIPTGLKWSTKSAQTAAEKGKYVRVDPSRKTTGERTISNAVKYWESTDPAENNDIFLKFEITDAAGNNVPVTITGRSEDVRQALLNAKFDASTVDQLLQRAITKQNYQTSMKAQYDQEIARSEELKKRAKNTTTAYSFDNILWFAANLKNATYGTDGGSSKGASVTSPSRRGGGRESLADRVQKLDADSVLDVSNYDIAAGTGARKTKQPGPTSSKIGIQGIPIVSNNYDKYVAALKSVYGDAVESQYAAQLAQLRQALSAKSAPAATSAAPVPTGVPPPGAPAPQAQAPLPGAQLAPPPSVAPVPSQGGGNFAAIPPVPTAN